MNKVIYMAGVAMVTMAICSCDEDTMTIGSSLTSENDKVVNTATEYEAQTRTIIADSVLSFTNTCYFGKVKDPETGADVTSEFTTQFHLLETTYIAEEDKILNRAEGRGIADSCDLVLYLQSPFMSDNNLTAMKMKISEMAVPMEDGRRYYSNFNPAEEGMLRVGGLSKYKMFTYDNMAENDSLFNTSTYQKNIRITLNEPYTDVNGVTYNNYGTYLMHQYYDHPENYRNSYVFAHNVCPGFFFEVTDGWGFHAQISDIGLRVYYTAQGDTAVVNGHLTLAGTQEVTQTTHVTNDMESILQLASETSHTYLKSPAGLFTEVTLPVADIKSAHQNDSLIACKMVFQRLNSQSSDDRSFDIPQNLLMVQRDSLYTFFEHNNIPDNITSYVSSYAASYANCYTFSNISNLITELWRRHEEGLAADADWEVKHPNWNKVVLVPVTLTKSSSTITNVENDMALTSTRLMGGPNTPLKVSVVYSRFK